MVGGNLKGPKGPRNLVEALGSFQRGPPRTQWVASSSLMNSTGSGDEILWGDEQPFTIFYCLILDKIGLGDPYLIQYEW